MTRRTLLIIVVVGVLVVLAVSVMPRSTPPPLASTVMMPSANQTSVNANGQQGTGPARPAVRPRSEAEQALEKLEAQFGQGTMNPKTEMTVKPGGFLPLLYLLVKNVGAEPFTGDLKLLLKDDDRCFQPNSAQGVAEYDRLFDTGELVATGLNPYGTYSKDQVTYHVPNVLVTIRPDVQPGQDIHLSAVLVYKDAEKAVDTITIHVAY